MMMMMMKCQFHWWRKLEHPEETKDLPQVTDKLSHMYVSGLCPVPVRYRTRATAVLGQEIQGVMRAKDEGQRMGSER